MTPQDIRFLHARWRHHARTIMPPGWEGYRNREPPRLFQLDTSPWKGSFTEPLHIGAEQIGLSVIVGKRRDSTRLWWHSPDLILEAFDVDGNPLGRIVRC